MKLYKIEFKISAQKELKNLPQAVQIAILEAIKLLALDPFHPLLPIRKMQSRSSDIRFRMRVGRYRVIYEVHKGKVTIFVIRIGHRKDVYR